MVMSEMTGKSAVRVNMSCKKKGSASSCWAKMEIDWQLSISDNFCLMTCHMLSSSKSEGSGLNE